MRARWKDNVWLAWLPLAAWLIPGAQAACTFSMAPAGGREHGAGTATNTFSVTTTAGCAWTLENPNNWITILTNPSGAGPGTIIVTYAVTPNPFPVARTGLVSIATNTISIRQLALTCSYSISPVLRPHGPGAAANSFDINANSAGCAWTVLNSNSWITLTSPTNGSGTTTVLYDVEENLSPLSRTGLVVVAGQNFNQVFTVTQRGVTCTYDLSPNDRSHGHSAAANSFDVATPAGCAWTVGNPNPWITIVSGASGMGDGTVAYTVAANPSGMGRTGLLTVGDQVFTLNQSGQPCTYSIQPNHADHGIGAETGLVMVTALTGCAWTVTNLNNWVLINSGASGAGNGTIGYSVLANPGPGPRSGTLGIGSEVFTITQPAPACFYKLSPTNRVHGPSTTSNSFSITAPGGCAWSVINTNPWLHLKSSGTGSGNASVGYTVDANTLFQERMGTFVVEGQFLVITQSGASCGINVTPSSRPHGHGATNNTLSITAAPGCQWSAVTTNAWITITSGSGTGNGTASYTIESNPSGLARSGTITVADEVFTIIQAGSPCSWSITPGDRNHGHGMASNSVTVIATPDCAWSVVNTNPWVSIVNGGSGAGDGFVGYTVNANPTTNGRSGTLVIAGQIFAISQSGAPCSYSIQPTQGVHGFQLETGLVRVTTVGGCPWTVSNTNNWVAITSGGAGGTQSGTVGYALATNPGMNPRIGYVTIAGQIFSVSQGAISCSYRLSPTSRTHGYSATSNGFSLIVSPGCGWSVVNTSSWINIVPPVTGSGGAGIGYMVSANTGAVTRTGVIVVGGQPFTVNQSPDCDLGVSPQSRTHGPGMASNAVSVTDSIHCGWTVVNTNGWLSFMSAAGSGTTNVNYMVAGNTAAVERVGVVIIGGEILTITQQAATCTISLSPASRQHGPGATSNSVMVTDNAGCGWSVNNTNGWINFLGLSGSGTTNLGYMVTANSSTNERLGVVLISGQAFSITQQQATCMLSISPAGRSHGHGAVSSSFSVFDNANCGWAVLNTSSWVSVTSPLTGSGTTQVLYSVSANLSLLARSAVIRVGDESFTVTQDGDDCEYRISPANRTHGFLATTNTFTVNTAANCAWTVLNTNSWVTLMSPANGVGSNAVTYSVTPNLTTNLRSGSIVANGSILNLSQRGATNGFAFEVTAIQDGSQLRLRLVGVPTGSWELQGSSNMQNWTKIGMVTNVAGAVEYIDPTPATLPHRFYRAIFR